jgi:hypothetical protein
VRLDPLRFQQLAVGEQGRAGAEFGEQCRSLIERDQLHQRIGNRERHCAPTLRRAVRSARALSREIANFPSLSRPTPMIGDG